MKRSSSVLAPLLLCLFATTLVAQDAPPPPPPYPVPITDYVGRYLDSSRTPNWQGPPPRTLRAGLVKAAPEFDRLYMISGGGTFAGQTLSTFADRVATEPLLTSRHGERYLRFEQWVDAERSPGWNTPLFDIQDVLHDFDWDDRGYIYLAYSVYGLGIIDSNFQLVRQFGVGVIAPYNVVAFRSGNSYYVLISGSDGGNSAIYDVTVPSSPVFVRVGPEFIEAAKTTDGRIALVLRNRDLAIYTPQGLVTNAGALQTVPSNFADVTTDGTNFYAVANTATRAIHILQPAGAAFTDTIVPAVPGRTYTSIEYGAGYLTALGAGRPAIYRVEGNTLTLLHDGTYFFDYHNLATDSGNQYVAARIFLPVHDGEQTLLIAAMAGVGDVFTLAEAPPLVVTKQFAPATIQPYGTSDLTVTITNPNAVPVSFSLSDTYPANVFNSGASPSTTCGGTAAVTASAGTGSFQLSTATVAASSSCTVTVTVTSSLSGSYPNTIPAGAIASDDNTNAAEATATLTVGRLAAPQIQKTFSSASTVPGVPFRLTITFTNPNAAGAVLDLAFTDSYPANLVNATPANATNTCGGTLIATNGGTSLSLSGGTIGASQSCTVAVDVVATGEGTFANVLAAGAVTSANAAANGAAATAIIIAAAHVGIPTLSQWAMLALLSVMAVAALLRLRL